MSVEVILILRDRTRQSGLAEGLASSLIILLTYVCNALDSLFVDCVPLSSTTSPISDLACSQWISGKLRCVFSCQTISEISLTEKVDDLLGMQNANLLNLPENYTFKYCLYSALGRPASRISIWRRQALHKLIRGRSVPRTDLARAVICRRRSTRSHCWIHISQDVGTPRPFASYHTLQIDADISREEEPTATPGGHVTSISVLRPYRRLGLANRLMRQARKSRCPGRNGTPSCRSAESVPR